MEGLHLKTCVEACTTVYHKKRAFTITELIRAGAFPRSKYVCHCGVRGLCIFL